MLSTTMTNGWVIFLGIWVAACILHFATPTIRELFSPPPPPRSPARIILAIGWLLLIAFILVAIWTVVDFSGG